MIEVVRRQTFPKL